MYLLYILVCAYSMHEHILYVLHSVHVCVCMYVCNITFMEPTQGIDTFCGICEAKPEVFH